MTAKNFRAPSPKPNSHYTVYIYIVQLKHSTKLHSTYKDHFITQNRDVATEQLKHLFKFYSNLKPQVKVRSYQIELASHAGQIVRTSLTN